MKERKLKEENRSLKNYIDVKLFDYVKPSYIVRKDIQSLLFDSLLKYDYHNFYWDFIKEQDYIDEKAKNFFNHLLDIDFESAVIKNIAIST